MPTVIPSRPISKAGGSRQRMWDILRRGGRTLPVAEIAKRAGCAVQTAQSYLGGLKAHGYVSNDDPEAEGWKLVKNTGPRSPSINLNTGSFCDWNEAKPMTGKELTRIWKASELSMNQFGVAVGLGKNNGTRIREMMDGTRAVSPKVEAGARKLSNNYP